MAFPQTSVSWDFLPGKLGMVYRSHANTAEMGVLPAVSLIQAGDLLERVFDATSATYVVRSAQSLNGALKSLAGVAVFKEARQPVAPPYTGTLTTGYQIGEMVPYVRKGKIYAKWLSNASAAQVPYSSPNYAHSSTPSLTASGAFTDKVAAVGAGVEVDACPTGISLCEDVTATLGFTVCLVDLNLP